MSIIENVPGMLDREGAVYGIMDSPLGRLVLVGSESGLTELRISGHDGEVPSAQASSSGAKLIQEAVAQLKAYIAGDLHTFDLPLAPRGTLFQQAVWSEVRKISYGQAVAYGEIAERLGNPKSVRAVGQANGRNPLPIFIPYHRVVAANGSLTGYAYGVGVKRWLLDHECGAAPQGYQLGLL
jgi:methylated-DNA-[protein]-cysteine S-methyltransferase